jgi:hypothetical protein
MAMRPGCLCTQAMRSGLLVCLVFLGAGLVACNRPSRDRAPASNDDPGRSGLRDLASVAAFQAHFDEDSAHPRLVLLLSPT